MKSYYEVEQLQQPLIQSWAKFISKWGRAVIKMLYEKWESCFKVEHKKDNPLILHVINLLNAPFIMIFSFIKS